MKKIILIIVFLTAGLIYKANANTSLQVGERFGFFYSSLAPYGSWIELDYGVTAWHPNIIARNWSPYRLGQWIWTSDGWYWDSYEPFGWVVYHYGRWYYDDYYGWIWIPDDQWAPAWVEWRYDNDYIGWAPLPPYANFSINIGIHFSVNYFTPYSHWHFVRYNNFCNPHLSNYYIGSQNVNRFFSRTKYRTNYGFRDGRVVNNGVDVGIIRERSGRDIRQREIKAVSSPDDLRLQDRDRNRSEIRSFIASREEISRGNRTNVQIRRADRSSTLETSRIELGRTRDLNRSDVNQNNIERGTREAVPKVENRNNGIGNREARPQSNPGQIEPRTNETRRANPNQDINRETRREPAPTYAPPKEERSREIQRESRPQQRIERAPAENRRSGNSSNGSRERRR